MGKFATLKAHFLGESSYITTLGNISIIDLKGRAYKGHYYKNPHYKKMIFTFPYVG